MSTKRQLIEGALDELGLSSYTWNTGNPKWTSSLQRMDRMAAMWESRSILSGYNGGGLLDDPAGVPDTTEEAFVSNLAVRIAPTIGKTVSRETMVAAHQSFNALIRINVTAPATVMPGIMPLGRGNRFSSRWQNFVTEPDQDTITTGQGSPIEV